MPDTVLIAQPYVPRYRAPFFAALSERLDGVGLRLELAVSRTESANADACSDLPTWTIPDHLASLTGARAHYRAPILQRRKDPDIAMVIVEQAAKHLDVLALLAHRRQPVGVWGHGGVYRNHRSLPKMVRLWMARQCDQFFVYTPAGKRYLVDHGVPTERVTVLHNTIDTAALRDQLAHVTPSQVATFRDAHGLVEGRVALYIGRVDATKDIDYLLACVPAAARALPGFVLLVGGEGDRSAAVRRAQQRGLPVRHLGRLDDHQKALAMAASDVVTIPSWIGLAAVDSLVAGLPIVTRDNASHCPEAEYLDRATHSLWLPAATSAHEYGRRTAHLLLDPDLPSMQAACRQASAGYPLSQMVDAFMSGILTCLSR